MRSITTIAFFLLPFAAASAMPHGKFGMPVSCARMNYCTEKHELYPQAVVDRLVHLHTISINISSPNSHTTSSSPSVDAIRKTRSVDGECEEIVAEEPIYEIIDADGDVRVVLQTEGFHQIVSIKRCLEPGHINYETEHFILQMVQKFNLLCVERKLEVSFMGLTQGWEGVEMIKPRTGISVGCDIISLNM